MNIFQTGMNIHRSAVAVDVKIAYNACSLFPNKIGVAHASVSKDTHEYYERFQNENIGFIKTLLRLKQKSPNGLITNANGTSKSPPNVIKEAPNRLLRPDEYPKPYRPHLSSNSKPKRKKSRSLTRPENNSPITSFGKQKHVFTPFLATPVQASSNEEKAFLVSYGVIKVKDCLKPKHPQPIQRTNSSSIINQPSVSTATSLTINNNGNQRGRSSSLSNKKKRVSKPNMSARTNCSLLCHKKSPHERVLYNLKRSDCNIVIHTITNSCNKSHQSKKTKEPSALLNNQATTSSMSKKPTVLKANYLEPQRKNVPIAEIDLFVEEIGTKDATKDERLNQPNEDEEEVEVILSKILLSPNNNKQKRSEENQTSNKSYCDVNTPKFSLSFIENVSSPAQTPLNNTKTNKTFMNVKPPYKFERKKKSTPNATN